MANFRDIIVFDFETGGVNPHTCQPTQIAAVAIHARKLELQPGGVFNSEMRPIIDDDKAIKAGVAPLEDKALEITRKTREGLAKAPLPKGVWKKFSQFCDKYNFKKTSYYAPIAAGYNINGYDMPIVERLCQQYGPIDEKRIVKRSLILFLLSMSCSISIVGLRIIKMSKVTVWTICETILGWISQVKTMLMMRCRTLRILPIS